MALTLYLARHADAANDNSIPDAQRPLTEDGLANAKLMGNRLRERGINPTRIVTSPALRARSTAQLFAEILGFPAENVQSLSSIYEATARTLQDVVAALPNDHTSILLIGHNPGVSRIVSHFTGEAMENMPPAAVACLSFEADDWASLRMNSGTMEWYDHPQNAIINSIQHV
jgi:phosphohistidine phosphatase